MALAATLCHALELPINVAELTKQSLTEFTITCRFLKRVIEAAGLARVCKDDCYDVPIGQSLVRTHRQVPCVTPREHRSILIARLLQSNEQGTGLATSNSKSYHTVVERFSEISNLFCGAADRVALLEQ